MAEPVVDLREIEPGIVLMTMQDRVNKNTFSEAIVEGLRRSFAIIDRQAQAKAVILTGYDSYFATGATKDDLLALQEGRMIFTDINIYDLALSCKVPVIAAMQGHGLGGGLTMGLFADFIILSYESIYSASFMKYGFTPGMGSTYVVPKKFGIPLGHEMLFTAQTYRGEELMRRGVPFPILPRRDVLSHACLIARELANKPRSSLTILKHHLTASIRYELPEFIKKEVNMHRKTFNRQEVKKRIHTSF